MAEKPLPAYDGDDPYVFVSYSHEDDEFVHPQIRWLQEQGFNVWWDEGISPGASWRAELTDALGECSLIIYFITPNSAASDQCTREINYGLDQFRRPVLAVHLLETELPHALGLVLSDRQAILQYILEPADYERKLITAVATYLDQPLPAIDSPSFPPSRKTSRQVSLFLAVACLLLVGGISIIGTWVATRPEPPTPLSMSRFALDLPAGVTLASGPSPFAISQDGRRIVFSGVSKEGSRLYVRALDDLEASPISGTEGAIQSVHLSPDGESVIFTDQVAFDLKKVSLSGGVPATVVQSIDQRRSLSWGRDGTVVFSVGPGLTRIADSGGTPEALTQPEEGVFHAHPYLLADGSAVLFDVSTSGELLRFDQIAVLSLVTGEQRILTEGSFPRVTSSGHLLFVREGLVWAMAFDADRLEVRGTAVPVLEGVSISNQTIRLSIAADGSMVYLPAGTLKSRPPDALVWVDLDGNEVTLPAPADDYFQPVISPDSGRVAVMRGDDFHLWVYSLERNTFTKLTDVFAPDPLWSPDGTKIMYTPVGDGVGTTNLTWRNADGTGVEERLTTNPRGQWPTSWSRDGNEVLYHECDTYAKACDLGRLTLTSEPSAELFLETEFNEMYPVLSADGRWVAYESDRSGRPEIYVRPYPDIDSGLWKISIDGGRQPLWSPDGLGLYYSVGVATSRQMMSVTIDSERGFVAGNAKPLFDFMQALPNAREYALHPDGERFLLARRGDTSGSTQHLIYVQNWLDEVKRLVPTE